MPIIRSARFTSFENGKIKKRSTVSITGYLASKESEEIFRVIGREEAKNNVKLKTQTND
jgi:hypothetical protein